MILNAEICEAYLPVFVYEVAQMTEKFILDRALLAKVSHESKNNILSKLMFF